MLGGSCYPFTGSCLTLFVLAFYHKIRPCRKYGRCGIRKAQDLYKEKSENCDVYKLSVKHALSLL